MTGALEWKTRKVFVTGGTGFIGSWLVQQLLRMRAEVTCLVRSENVKSNQSECLRSLGAKIIVGNIENFDGLKVAVAEAKPEVVFHLAALNLNFGCDTSPMAIFETNVRGTCNILESCRIQNGLGALILASSAEVEALELKRPYQVSKFAAELMGQAFSETSQIPLGIVRSKNVYGGGDFNWQRLIPGTILALYKGQQPVLRSDGRSQRDYLFVDDLVRGYILTAQHVIRTSTRGDIFHFATGIGTSTIDVVAKICELMDKKNVSPLITNTSPLERSERPYKPDILTQSLGWNFDTNLTEGLGKTVAWYKQYLMKTPMGV